MSFLCIIIAIALIVAIVFIIRNLKNYIVEEYKGANILSLFFPIVGLIIYAVNIGKNDKLAKSCGKMALNGMLIGIIIYLIVLACLGATYTASNIRHIKTISK